MTDANGDIRTFKAAIFTAQSWTPLSKIACDDSLFPIDHWTAIERTHYMESSKLFVPVDRPFGLDKAVDDRGNPTGRDVMSMTLTDRMTRGPTSSTRARTSPPSSASTWCDDSLKWLPLSANQRMAVTPKSLGEIYPKVDHIIGNPVTGAPGERALLHGRVQGQPARPLPLPAPPVHALHAGSAARGQAGHLPRRRRHLLDGRARAEGACADRAERGLGRHAPAGATDPTNPGPGDAYDEIAPANCPRTRTRSGRPSWGGRSDSGRPRRRVHLGGQVLQLLGVPRACRSTKYSSRPISAYGTRSDTIWSTLPWKGWRSAPS